MGGDIVIRLRDIAAWKPDGLDEMGWGFDECAEAADEIERLRAAIEHAVGNLSVHSVHIHDTTVLDIATRLAIAIRLNGDEG